MVQLAFETVAFLLLEQAPSVEQIYMRHLLHSSCIPPYTRVLEDAGIETERRNNEPAVNSGRFSLGGKRCVSPVVLLLSTDWRAIRKMPTGRAGVLSNSGEKGR